MTSKKILLMLFTGIFASLANAQILDHFSDGNFIVNPSWLGDDSLFTVNTNLQLQSKGSGGAGKDICLSTSSSQRFNGEWSCWMRFALNPSPQNFCRFYVCSDQQNLKGSLNGFYVQLGGTTGNGDSIVLYKQSGLNRIRLISGRAGTVSKLNNVLQLKVTCDSIGNWQLFSDTSASDNFILEGSAFDNSIIQSVYAGYFVRYTTSNINNFYFDDVYIGIKRIDTMPPAVNSIEIINLNTLHITFSERMNAVNLSKTLSYELDQIVHPILISNKVNTVTLTFTDSFSKGTLHYLKLRGLSDVAGNLLNDTTIAFTYNIAQKNDLLITEFMADPDPPQGLPNAEFIELYNNGKYALQLKNYKIKDASSYAVLPSFVLEPDSFVIINEVANEPLFHPYGSVINVAILPSLNNAGDQLSLTDANDNVIHKLSYDLNTYHNTGKQNGGWTLEMINPKNICAGANNWQASINTTGGTPGKQNSVWQIYEDTLAPLLVAVNTDSIMAISLLFNEPLDTIISKPVCNLILNGSALVHQLIFNMVHTNIISFNLDTALTHASTYKLLINGVDDCKGNEKDQAITFTYMAVKDPLQNQLVINEIMSSPSFATAMPNTEFIELYNAGRYAVNLKDYSLNCGTSTAHFPPIIIYPDSFLLVSGTTGHALIQLAGTSIGLPNFPSLSSDGIITLYNDRGYILHQVMYKDSYMNSPLKQQSGGWTLEMKDVNNPCGMLNNWTASIDIKGGTPGKINSIKQTNKDITAPQLLRAYPIDSTHLRCYFNEAMDSLFNGDLTGITVTNSIHPFQYRYANTNINQFEYAFENSFDTAALLSIYIDGLKDCVGNSISNKTVVDFGIAQKADSGDLIINEVLFNPTLNGNDFVELYNKSNKFIDLNAFKIARYNDQHQPEQACSLGALGYIIAPYNYIVITFDPVQLTTYFNVPYPDKMMAATLPALNDDAGSVVLLDKNNHIMDELIYTDKMHFELLANKEGVSLERIDPNRATNDVTNWTSAASSCGYATPTYRNSQYTPITKNGSFTIDPEVFSPDGDGYKDILTFSYDLKSNSNVGKIEIYNSTGNLVKKICSNFYLGATGQISWNGITDDGGKAGIGIYIANFETFNLQGQTQQFQKTFVVGGK